MTTAPQTTETTETTETTGAIALSALTRDEWHSLRVYQDLYQLLLTLIHDQGAGEQCDDGNTLNNDGCDANCRREEVDGYDGTYNLAPEVGYTCLALGLFTVIDYAFTSFVFSVHNDTLTVAARPRGLPDVVMTQSPAPEDGTFDVTVTIPGTCDETYRLAGSFQDEDQWTGTFSRTLRGDCFDCTDGTVDQVQGTRQ